MALFRGLGARKDATRGTTPIEVRKVLAGLFTAITGGIGARPGILLGADSPLVTGNATWAYNVGVFHAFVTRGATDGGQLYGNDGSVLIGTTGVGSTVPVAPGAGLQRIDIIWTRHPANTENGDVASEPLFGVASGADAAVAVAPAIPTGALELARNLMTSAATNTLSAGNTITQSGLYTGLRGAPVPVRTQTERDALAAYDGLRVYRFDTHSIETYNSGLARWIVGTSAPSFRINAPIEAVNILAATAPAATQNIDATTAGVWYFQGNAANNAILNFRGGAAASLDSLLLVNESITFAVRITNGATPYYVTSITIDGGAVAPHWTGGAAPTSGNANARDLYTFSIVKTAVATFDVTASIVKA